MFKEFFKTTIGMKDKCGGTKTAEDGMNPVAASMKGAFGTPPKAPEPDPAPADVSAGSLGSRITAGLKSMTGG